MATTTEAVAKLAVAEGIAATPSLPATGLGLVEGAPSDTVAAENPIICTTEPFAVPMELHRENRRRLLEFFKPEDGVPANTMIVLEGGHAETRHDSDHELLFRQESWFQWVFGVREPDCFGAIHVDTGRSILFIPRLPAEYAIWMGHIPTPDDFKAKYEVDEAFYVDEMEATFKEMSPSRVYVNSGLCSDSGATAHSADFPGRSEYDVDSDRLFLAMTECRVIKAPLELDIMRFACIASSEAHLALMSHARPGLREFQLESLFKHWVYYHGGCRNVAYTCICATGDNASVLHYGHAGAPNDRLINDGDMCLFDLGGEFHCYASDITCSFPVNGKFTDDQRLVYSAVLASQDAVLDALKPGVSWVDMHALSYRAALTVLRDGGLLTGDIDDMMAANLGSVFMPHGLGHFLGLDTHDVGGYPAEFERLTEAGFKSLRTVRTLRENMVITVEPGVYFVKHLLDSALANPAQSGFINTDVLERFRGTGGVRLEDDIRITSDGFENLTWCPRRIEDVEAACAGKITSRFDFARKAGSGSFLASTADA